MTWRRNLISSQEFQLIKTFMFTTSNGLKSYYKIKKNDLKKRLKSDFIWRFIHSNALPYSHSEIDAVVCQGNSIKCLGAIPNFFSILFVRILRSPLS